MKHRVSHPLDQETARQVVERAAERYSERLARYSPALRWTGSDRAEVTFSARGLRVTGSVQLEPGAIVFEVNVPLLMRPFAGRATGVLDREVGRWVERAQRGEL